MIKKLKKLGMNALLGVGMGSIRGSYLVTMEWMGAKNNSKPLAFVGKGVTYWWLFIETSKIHGRHDLRYGRFSCSSRFNEKLSD